MNPQRGRWCQIRRGDSDRSAALKWEAAATTTNAAFAITDNGRVSWQATLAATFASRKELLSPGVSRRQWEKLCNNG